MIHNRYTKLYLRRVRGMLPHSPKKTRILEQIRNEISLYLKEHPEADYNAVVARFGEPESIAASYVEGMGAEEILRRFRIRKLVVSAVAIVLSFILVTWSATVIWAIHSNETEREGYVIVSID